MRYIVAAFALLISVPAWPQGSAGSDTNAALYTQPAENLILIVADIQRHLTDDIYKYPYPQDVLGQNVFRAAIVQLSNYEKLYPNHNTDLVNASRAQCYERLSAFKEAALNYDKALKTEDSALKQLVQKGFDRCKEFSAIVDREFDQSSLRSYEDGLRLQITDLEKLSTKYSGTPFQCLAKLEKERAQMALAEFISMFRFMKPYTTPMAIEQIKKNIDANKDSKLRFSHHLMLATLNYELAREYTILHDPEGPDFNLKEFESFANTARGQLEIIEQADGFAEKQEGRALLTGLEAFVDRIRDRAR